jgi:hypothetical protein
MTLVTDNYLCCQGKKPVSGFFGDRAHPLKKAKNTPYFGVIKSITPKCVSYMVFFSTATFIYGEKFANCHLTVRKNRAARTSYGHLEVTQALPPSPPS